MNCTGKNMSKDLLVALGEADANMYLCSKEIRPGTNIFSFYAINHTSTPKVQCPLTGAIATTAIYYVVENCTKLFLS